MNHSYFDIKQVLVCIDVTNLWTNYRIWFTIARVCMLLMQSNKHAWTDILVECMCSSGKGRDIERKGERKGCSSARGTVEDARLANDFR